MSTLPAFSLRDLHGQTRAFPASRPALLCFVKADCPTCGISMPLIEATYRAYGAQVAVWAVGQDLDNTVLVERHQLNLPMLDDSALQVSFQYDIEEKRTSQPGGQRGAGLNAIPLWLIEGMAEYLSIGRVVISFGLSFRMWAYVGQSGPFRQACPFPLGDAFRCLK